MGKEVFVLTDEALRRRLELERILSEFAAVPGALAPLSRLARWAGEAQLLSPDELARWQTAVARTERARRTDWHTSDQGPAVGAMQMFSLVSPTPLGSIFLTSVELYQKGVVARFYSFVGDSHPTLERVELSDGEGTELAFDSCFASWAAEIGLYIGHALFLPAASTAAATLTFRLDDDSAVIPLQELAGNGEDHHE